MTSVTSSAIIEKDNKCRLVEAAGQRNGNMLVICFSCLQNTAQSVDGSIAYASPATANPLKTDSGIALHNVPSRPFYHLQPQIVAFSVPLPQLQHRLPVHLLFSGAHGQSSGGTQHHEPPSASHRQLSGPAAPGGTGTLFPRSEGHAQEPV